MGSTGSMSMKAARDEGMIDTDNMLIWHLQSNCFPPFPLSFVAVAKKAIKRGNEAIATGDRAIWGEEIDLPDGIKYKDGKTTITVGNAIDSLRLDHYLDSDEDY